jgi:cytochrome bd-type quinol oxidase subunit 2
MGFLIIIALLALSSWMLFVTVRRLRRRHASQAWWLAFFGFAIVGVVLGYWLAFHFEYQASSQLRFFSFPIPVNFFHLEDGQWVDFPTPLVFGYPAMFTNIVAITAFAVLPVLVASLFSHRQETTQYDSTRAT